MKYFLLLIFFVPANRSLCQRTSPEIIRIYQPEPKFDDLKNSSDIFSFRLWDKGQIIDLRILSDSTKVATVINCVTHYPFPEIFIQKIVLPDEEIVKAFNVIENCRIYELPSDDSIKNWKPVLDGEWFSTEQKVNGMYLRKYYGNPTAQGDLPEAIRFIEFTSVLEKTLKLNDYFRTFIKDSKIDCYTTYGDGLMKCITWDKVK